MSAEGPKVLPKKLRPEINSPIDLPRKPAEQITHKRGRRQLLTCPYCSRSQLTRVSCQGMSEHLLSLIYIYPFRCRACGSRFRRQEWGVRYQRQRRN